MDLMLRILAECWGMTVEMAPYLLLGFAIAGLLSAFITPDTVERHLGGRGLWPVMKASVLGVPLPLCSCGVLPVAASLRKHGAGKGATVSFLLSTPQTGVDSILVTYSLLGPVFAVFRPIAAFITGIVGGTATDWLDPDAVPGPGKREPCHDECCGEEARKQNRLAQSLRHGFVVLPRDIAPTMVAGLAIAGLVSAVVPDDFFAGRLGTGFVSMLLMLAISVPVYVCAAASAPIAAALMLKGLSPGAALVFMIAGPATSAATLVTVWKILGAKTVFIYLGAVAATALLCGTILNMIVETAAPIAAAAHVHNHAANEANPFGAACAVVLLAVLGVAWIGSAWRRPAA
jgi:uncharacterized membrane protein YraQ (UPF0718 family)